MTRNTSRRDFLRQSAAAGLGLLAVGFFTGGFGLVLVAAGLLGAGGRASGGGGAASMAATGVASGGCCTATGSGGGGAGGSAAISTTIRASGVLSAAGATTGRPPELSMANRAMSTPPAARTPAAIQSPRRERGGS